MADSSAETLHTDDLVLGAGIAGLRAAQGLMGPSNPGCAQHGVAVVRSARPRVDLLSGVRC